MSDKPTIHELEEILDGPDSDVNIAPDGSVHVGPSYEALKKINSDLLAALKSIKGLSPGGPHVSAKAGFEAVLSVLGQARTIAREAITKAEQQSAGGQS